MLSSTRIAELSFDLGEEIGHEGKNSKVFKAKDLQLGADIVVKKIPKTDFSNIDEYFKEASMLYLSSHPNVVPIYYGCQNENYIYLAMPHYQKGSLKKRIEIGPISVREIIVYTTQILSGLHNIHSKGLIHFDVKPDNILLSERNEALLSDFGLAKQTSYSGIAGQDRLYGKMAPPEAFNTENFNNQFDIYQVGLTVHRMCVGDVSFYCEYNSFIEGGTLNRHRFRHAVINGQFPNLKQYPEHIPQALVNTVKKCLAGDLSQRYSAAIEVVNDLADIDGELLDWQMTSNEAGRKWCKQLSDGRQYELLEKADGSCKATKISAQGRTQRIADYCRPSLNRSEIKRFLRGH